MSVPRRRGTDACLRQWIFAALRLFAVFIHGGLVEVLIGVERSRIRCVSDARL